MQGTIVDISQEGSIAIITVEDEGTQDTLFGDLRMTADALIDAFGENRGDIIGKVIEYEKTSWGGLQCFRPA